MSCSPHMNVVSVVNIIIQKVNWIYIDFTSWHYNRLWNPFLWNNHNYARPLRTSFTFLVYEQSITHLPYLFINQVYFLLVTKSTLIKYKSKILGFKTLENWESSSLVLKSISLFKKKNQSGSVAGPVCKDKKGVWLFWCFDCKNKTKQNPFY